MPCDWCEKEYNCPIAKTPQPQPWFYQLLYLYKIQRGGFRIENEWLSLSEWASLGEMSECIEQAQDKNTLSALSTEMYTAIVSGISKRGKVS